MQTSLAKKLFAAGVAISTAVTALAPFAAKAAAHAVGTNVKTSDGTVWMIMPDGTRRAYTSAGAFLSYGFNSFATLVDANAEDAALPQGAFIPPQDGTIFCATQTKASDVQGECSLITGGMKAAFTSEANFSGRGFSFANAQYGDSSFLTKTTNIDNTTDANRPGVLVNDNGTVKLVGNSGVLGIPDLMTFNSWGYSWAKVVPANAADKALPQTGVMAARQAGQLSPTALSGNPTTPPPASGTVSVSLAGNNAASATVPLGATNVPFVKFNVYNGGATAATLTGLTVKRTGAGSTVDIANVYVYQGSSRLSSGRSINSSSNEAVFSGLSIVVPAYGSVTLDILGDIAASGTATAGNVHALSVMNAMFSSTAASGMAQGNNMTLAGVSAGSIDINDSGTITNPKVGEQNVKVGQFQLVAGTSEDLVVKRISLIQGGALTNSYLTNLVLKQAGNTLGTVAALDSKDKANFDVNFALAKGDTKTFEVYANVSGSARSGSSETIKFYLEEASDIYAVGQTFGFGVAVTNSDYDGQTCTSSSSNTDCSYSEVEGGTLTITFNGPAAKDIAKNGKDVEVFNFTMAAQNNLEVRQLILNISGSDLFYETGTDVSNFTDVKVVDTTTGAVVWGPKDVDFGSETTEVMTFTEDVTLAAGTSKTFKVTMDVANNGDLVSGDTLTVSLEADAFTSSDVRNLDNNTYLTSSDVVPTSDIAGNQMTVRIVSLETALAGTPTSKSFVKGSQNVEAAGFVFTASTGGDVRVDSITLTGNIASSTSDTLEEGRQATGASTYVNVSDDIVTVELYDGATKIGQTKSPAITTGLVQFTGLNWVIPAGTSKTLIVKMSISNSATASDAIRWEIEAGNITATDVDGNAVEDTSTSGLTVVPDADLNATGSQTASNTTTITITGAGTISVTSAGNEQGQTDARIVTAGTMGVTLGKMTFTAATEELKVTKARINVVSVNNGAVNVADNISSLYLYDGNTKVAGPVGLTPSGTYEGYADFNSISPEFVVGKDATRTLTVKADLNTITNGADSGDEFAVNLSSSNFEARGTSGSTQTTSFSGSYLGNYVVLRKSQPRIEVVPIVGATLTNGNQPLFRFKVTAVDGDVALKKFIFTHASSGGISLSNPTVREVGGTDIASASSTLATSLSHVSFTDEERVLSGQSRTFEFRATVAGADATGDNITTNIASDSATVTGDLGTQAADQNIDDQDGTNAVGNGSNLADAAFNFTWSDISAVPHNDDDDGSDDWTNGRHVRILPTDTQTLTYPN